MTAGANSKLTVRQKRFIWEYLSGETAYNALGSARKAGYSENNKRIGVDLLRNPTVAREINQRLLELQVRMEWDADDVRNVFARIAFDPREPKAGGPSNSERIAAATKLGESIALFKNATLNVDSSLAELLALARQQEASMPPAEPPARLKLVHDATDSG